MDLGIYKEKKRRCLLAFDYYGRAYEIIMHMMGKLLWIMFHSLHSMVDWAHWRLGNCARINMIDKDMCLDKIAPFLVVRMQKEGKDQGPNIPYKSIPQITFLPVDSTS